MQESEKYHVHTFKKLSRRWGGGSVGIAFAIHTQGPEFKSLVLIAEAGYGGMWL